MKTTLARHCEEERRSNPEIRNCVLTGLLLRSAHRNDGTGRLPVILSEAERNRRIYHIVKKRSKVDPSPRGATVLRMTEAPLNPPEGGKFPSFGGVRGGLNEWTIDN